MLHFYLFYLLWLWNAKSCLTVDISPEWLMLGYLSVVWTIRKWLDFINLKSYWGNMLYPVQKRTQTVPLIFNLFRPCLSQHKRNHETTTWVLQRYCTFFNSVKIVQVEMHLSEIFGVSLPLCWSSNTFLFRVLLHCTFTVLQPLSCAMLIHAETSSFFFYMTL